MKAKKLMAMGLAVTLCVSATACGKNKETTQVSKVSVEVENPQMGELTSDTTLHRYSRTAATGICDAEAVRNSHTGQL